MFFTPTRPACWSKTFRFDDAFSGKAEFMDGKGSEEVFIEAWEDSKSRHLSNSFNEDKEVSRFIYVHFKMFTVL